MIGDKKANVRKANPKVDQYVEKMLEYARAAKKRVADRKEKEASGAQEPTEVGSEAPKESVAAEVSATTLTAEKAEPAKEDAPKVEAAKEAVKEVETAPAAEKAPVVEESKPVAAAAAESTPVPVAEATPAAPAK